MYCPVQTAKRSRAEEHFPVLAYDPATQVFICDDLDEVSYAGAVWVGVPLPGADETTVAQLKSTLSIGFPAGTLLQVSQVSVPDITSSLHLYARRHDVPLSEMSDSQRTFLREAVERRIEFIRKGTEAPLVESNKVLVNSRRLLISLKVPVARIPSDDDLETANSYAVRLEESLQTLGVYLQRLTPPEYLGIMRQIFHIWEPMNQHYDEMSLLKDQILTPGDNIEVHKDHIKINDTYVRPVSVKNYPNRATLAMMAYLIGDPSGLSNQITMPWMMTTTLHFPDQRQKASAVRNKAQAITYQAYGPLLRFIPRLAYKKQGFDILVHSLEQGEMLVEASFTLTLFGRSIQDVERLTSRLRTYYSIHQFDVAPEQYICWPVFWNTLPLFPSQASLSGLSRLKTMTVKHAVQFLPVLGEWTGTGTGAASIFISRRGQPVLFDLFDSETSYNAVIFAESGAGKSFLTQHLVVDYLAAGAKIWIIDVGRSYEKLVKVLNGQFMEFHEDSNICLNPFSNCNDIDDDMDLLRSIVGKMAAPREGLNDYMASRVEEAIRAVWQRMGPAMTITDIYEYLVAQTDQRLRDLGNMLYPWTKYGSYGVWFNGANNLDFSQNLVVLELEELKARQHLQQVVLLQLIARIQHEMYLSQKDQPKLVIIDEAWDLLDDPGVAKFMEHGYRRFRKYGGAAIVVTQSINDLYSSPNGRAIAENSPTKIIMQQRAESIEAVEKEGKVSMEPYAFQVMKEIHTVRGKYSECLFHTNRGWGVGRLIVDRFNQVLFSTTGPERTEILKAIRAGVPAQEAIQAFCQEAKNEGEP